MGQIISIDDLQAEGFTGPQFAEDRATRLIALVEDTIQKITGRTFYKVDDHTECVNGRGTAVLRLLDPVLSIDSIADSDGNAIDLDTVVKVEDLNPESYLRLPRLRLTDGSTWTRGAANYLITGSFGFVTFNGEAWVPPPLIKRAAILMVGKWSDDLADRAASGPREGMIKSESKGNYSYTLADNAISQGTTGDSEIDGILAGYKRRHGVMV